MYAIEISENGGLTFTPNPNLVFQTELEAKEQLREVLEYRKQHDMDKFRVENKFQPAVYRVRKIEVVEIKRMEVK